MPSFHAFRLNCDLGGVPPLRERFARDCREAGVVDEEGKSVMLVLEELVNNSIEHGCTMPEHCVEGFYRISETSIEVEVTDPGEILTQEDFSDADASDFAENGRGAGLFLVQALSDEVHVRRAPKGGTTVHVVKRRNGQWGGR